MTGRQHKKIIADVIQEMAEVDRRQQERRATRAANGTVAKPRPKCTCPAYRFPHRPGGGLCRWPEPPLQTWNGVPGKSKPSILRCTRGVREGLLHQLEMKFGWHPIRNRRQIHRWIPKLYVAWWRRRGWSLRPDLPAMRICADTDMFAVSPQRTEGGRTWEL